MPHEWRVQSDKDAHQGRFGQQCQQCHKATTWQDATFDHSRVNFPLTGAHARWPASNATRITHSLAHPQHVWTATRTQPSMLVPSARIVPRATARLLGSRPNSAWPMTSSRSLPWLVRSARRKHMQDLSPGQRSYLYLLDLPLPKPEPRPGTRERASATSPGLRPLPPGRPG